LDKRCHCNVAKSIELRTVIFSERVTIRNVPVKICNSCNFCELFPDIKRDLKKRMIQWGTHPNKQIIWYHENHELAYILYEANRVRKMNTPICEMITTRINELLDLFILAQSVGDLCWMDELRNRMWQLSQGLNHYDDLM
jgi:hypothetical protein